MSDKEENIENTEETNQEEQQENSGLVKKVHLSGMYKEWFLDYASYVILERAVPHIYDGLKPVQRRILHSMKRMDDGRYNKVANIIGHTMQFHPHGDASIGDALVQLGQKNLLIDTQGNWGNTYTGDSSAAPRYIEARLTKFALDVVFNHKTTFFKPSYDGRNEEPITLPVKFPLLLAQGAEGIAVGLASKILPHNFNELIDAAIASLEDRPFEIYPDFHTGGLADVSKYNNGLRGGQVRVRAKIEKIDNKKLVIRDLPFGKNTTQLIDSVIKANDKGKIKIKKIDDNTSDKVEIIIHLPAGTSSDITIDALYAFTDCEVSISPNVCVIEEDKPRFVGVKEILEISAQNTVFLLKREQEIRRDELLEEWHNNSLEKIFIENRIYNDIEDCETFESIIETIDKGLDPFKPSLKREVTRDDIIRLTEIKIKRISKYDAFKADERIKRIEEELVKVNKNIKNIIPFTINYYKDIQAKYGKGKERKTELRSFDNIEAAKVVMANEKLYANKKEGFIGTSLRKEEFICECSDIDDIIVFRKDGSYLVTKVSEKSFVGKDIIHIDIFLKNDDRTVYNLAYKDGKAGSIYVKRFAVKSITRDKEYSVGQNLPGTKILYFSANPNGEAEVIKAYLKPKPKLRKLVIEFDFKDLSIKGRSAKGNTLSKHDVHKITLKEQGVSTLGGLDVWFDSEVLRLNNDERGTYLGEFLGEDKVLVIYKSGYYELTSFDVSNHYEKDILIIEKYIPGKIYTCIYFDSEQEYYYIKRFEIEDSSKPQEFIPDTEKTPVKFFSDNKYIKYEVFFGGKHAGKEAEIIDAIEFIGVKSYRAKGKRLSNYQIEAIKEIQPTEKAVIIEDYNDIEENIIVHKEIEIDKTPIKIEEQTIAGIEVEPARKLPKSKIGKEDSETESKEKKSTKKKKKSIDDTDQMSLF